MSFLRELESGKINALIKPNSPFIKNYIDIESFLPDKTYLRPPSEDRKLRLQQRQKNSQQANLPHYDSKNKLKVQRNLFGAGSSSSSSTNERSDSFDDKENHRQSVNAQRGGHIKTNACRRESLVSQPSTQRPVRAKKMTYEVFSIYHYVPPDNKTTRSTQTDAEPSEDQSKAILETRKGTIKSLIESGFLTPKENSSRILFNSNNLGTITGGPQVEKQRRAASIVKNVTTGGPSRQSQHCLKTVGAIKMDESSEVGSYLEGDRITERTLRERKGSSIASDRSSQIREEEVMLLPFTFKNKLHELII